MTGRLPWIRRRSSLFREGPFDAATPPLGHNKGGCAYRFTTYRDYDYAVQDGLFGMQIHHPRFLEWVGAPESARLLGRAPSEWIRSLARLQTLDAARHIQRDACLMTSNLSVLDQYALSLHGTASDMLELAAVTTFRPRLWIPLRRCRVFAGLPHTWRLWAYDAFRTALVGQLWTSSIRALRVPVILPVCRECTGGSRFPSSRTRELLPCIWSCTL